MAASQRIAVARVQHRLGFGPAGTEYGDAVQLDGAAAVAAMLLGVTPAAAARDARITPPPALPFLTLAQAGSRTALEQARRDQEHAMKLWWLDRMVTTSQPLLERVTWFWHGHWATSEVKVRNCAYMFAQNSTLRTNALGSFSQQCRAMLRDPAMLIWLDGQGNRKGRPNENLGREFLELFTLGDGNYTENDVREASRALTGWQIDALTGVSSRVDARFDTGLKTILGSTANFDVDLLADFVSSQPASARFIAKRMFKRLVSETPPTDAQVQLLADAFGRERNIGALVAALGGVLADTQEPLPWAKSPVDWAVSTMRALGVRPSELPDAVQKGLMSDLSIMGQQPFFPPNVSGWPSGRNWFSSTSTQARIKCTRRIVTTTPSWLKRASVRQRPTVLADRLGVASWSGPTQQALADATIGAGDALMLALNSPDYLVGV